jgi:hypothetical protein
MHDAEESERYTRIAIRLLQMQNRRTIFMLKDFLTNLPSPSFGKQILTAAITKLVDISPDTVCWLLNHSDVLQPEVDVVMIVTQAILERLVDLGLIYERDFQFKAHRRLELSEAAKLALSAHCQSLNLPDPLPILDWVQNFLD